MELKLTLKEIMEKDFNKQLKGYSCKEVDEFLDDVIVDIQQLQRNNSLLEAKIQSLNEKLQRSEDLEKNLGNTLVMAQGAADAALEQAKAKAELIVEEARETAKHISLNAHVEHADVVRELQKSKLEFENYRRRVLTYMESQMLSFESTTRDLAGPPVPAEITETIESVGAKEPTNDMTTIYDFKEELTEALG